MSRLRSHVVAHLFLSLINHRCHVQEPLVKKAKADDGDAKKDVKKEPPCSSDKHAVSCGFFIRPTIEIAFLRLVWTFIIPITIIIIGNIIIIIITTMFRTPPPCILCHRHPARRSVLRVARGGEPLRARATAQSAVMMIAPRRSRQRLRQSSLLPKRGGDESRGAKKRSSA